MSELSYKVDEENDIVKVDDKLIKEENKLVYILLNKPEGYITTVKDQFNRPSVLDLVSDIISGNKDKTSILEFLIKK